MATSEKMSAVSNGGSVWIAPLEMDGRAAKKPSKTCQNDRKRPKFRKTSKTSETLKKNCKFFKLGVALVSGCRGHAVAAAAATAAAAAAAATAAAVGVVSQA